MTKKNSNDKDPLSIGVIGAGSWGTALAIHLSRLGVATTLWGHRSEHVKKLQQERENQKYLPGQRFPELLQVSSSLEETISAKQVLCLVVPSHVFRQTFQNISYLLKGKKDVPEIYLSATKGVENETFFTMTQIIDHYLKEVKIPGTVAVLSGPSFAKEVAKQLPTAITIGSRNADTAKILQRIFNTEYFRVYTSSDVVGLEISAALKNIIAIAAGVCDGLGFGNNARAALITRGLVEITRMGKALGAEEKTFYGLSGLGDLVLTCTGDLSRNRHVGLELGKGNKIEDILKNMSMVAEGVKTTLSGYLFARKLGISMPILEQMYNILYRGKNTAEAAKSLLTRDLKEE
ncbi:NAD(P)H-dependent glycerol-3-phosphate dehydrogenase [Desulfofustis limnaeus]|jgi:glycerol-3-phosphate dehydrogenase (NAD(P)+)|uniref:Glycerol-3-phosphate dehydrogenase [NAD(P)+] n=1 Tax=Desulfofustis limnaeus TaxID=2740163 RepID=A0ABM7WDQ2_9BACT|nr:NAD(P)H-dependent glycerol-3-phosphate dehydrogenase [Desulfofustis limnaeus]BDD89090.1 glycerol-3-phosphate dehydrogenase [NAD(P)+] [Desulfofustis limnaeus]